MEVNWKNGRLTGDVTEAIETAKGWLKQFYRKNNSFEKMSGIIEGGDKIDFRYSVFCTKFQRTFSIYAMKLLIIDFLKQGIYQKEVQEMKIDLKQIRKKL